MSEELTGPVSSSYSYAMPVSSTNLYDPIVINQDSPQISQPSKVHVILYPHQLTMAHKMLSVEHTRTVSVDLSVDSSHDNDLTNHHVHNDRLANYDLKINTAVLHDQVGSGKTLTALAVICTEPIPTNRSMTIMRQGFECDLGILNDDEICPANVVVIPNHLSIQWKQELAKTDLKFASITTDQDLCDVFAARVVDVIDFGGDVEKRSWLVYEHKTESRRSRRSSVSRRRSPTLEESMAMHASLPPPPLPTLYNINTATMTKIFNTTDVILVTQDMFDKLLLFSRQCKFPVFARVFLDDINRISESFCAKALFTWVISATQVKCNFSNQFSSKLQHAYICNAPSYINASIKLPKPNVFLIRTALTRFISRISQYVPPEAMRMINAGNLKQAIKFLNCNTDTQDNIIQVINSAYQKEHDNLKKQYACTESLDIPIDDKQTRLDDITTKLAKIELKINNIKERINDMMIEDCIICTEPHTNPTIVNCCNAVMCVSCLLKSLNQTQGKCPMCRSLITEADYKLVKIDADTGLDTTSSLSSRLDQVEIKTIDKVTVLNKILASLFQANQDASSLAKVIICSDYDATLDNISLNNPDFAITRLRGNAAQVDDILTKFNAGEIHVLFINSRQYGAGLNIPFATHLILFHKMHQDTETQVIGRAQRLGRTSALNIIYLRDNNEDYVSNATELVTIRDLGLLV